MKLYVMLKTNEDICLSDLAEGSIDRDQPAKNHTQRAASCKLSPNDQLLALKLGSR